MNLKRRAALVSEASADRSGTNVKPLSAQTPRLISLSQRGHSTNIAPAESDGSDRVTAVLQEMAEQVRQLAATVDSLRGEIK